MNVLGIIPARYASSRFSGKPLADIGGKTMIQRVYEQCLQAKSLHKVIVATDDFRIFETVKAFHGNVQYTSSTCLNGTERCAEIAELLKDDFDFVVNIQGDEPFIQPTQIDELCALFDLKKHEIYTQVKLETSMDNYNNINIVKADLDSQLYAKDFYREPKSILKDSFYRHIGLYGYSLQTVLEIVQLSPTERERQLHLEQCRWFDHGYSIKTGITTHQSISIDTPEDLQQALIFLEKTSLY